MASLHHLQNDFSLLFSEGLIQEALPDISHGTAHCMIEWL